MSTFRLLVNRAWRFLPVLGATSEEAALVRSHATQNASLMLQSVGLPLDLTAGNLIGWYYLAKETGEISQLTKNNLACSHDDPE